MVSINTRTTKTVFKIFLAWQDQKEEKWLEEMASRGWFLDKVSPYLYSFRKAEPQKVVYRLDYKNSFAQDYAEYLSLFKDSNWQLVGMFSNWHYYMTTVNDQNSPEIFNSDRSRAQKYRRMLYFLVPLGLLIVSPAINLFNFASYRPFDVAMIFTKGFYALAVILYIYCIIRVLIKVRQLESNTSE